MNKPPAFQFYPDKWLSSQRVQLLTLEEEGAYIRLCCSCWQHGSVPADPETAARLVGKGCSRVVAENVLKLFCPSAENGRLIHDRLALERQKQEAWRRKSSIGGQKSAESRSRVVPRVVEPPCQPKGNTTSSSSSSSIKPTKPTNLPARAKGGFSKGHAELTGRFHRALNLEWENDRQKWMTRIKQNSGKCERIIADVERAKKDGEIKKTAAGYAEALWRDWT